MLNHEYFLTILIYSHDENPKLADWKRLGKENPVGVDIESPEHEEWSICSCNAAQHIKNFIKEHEMTLDEDSPSNMLTVEEHIILFNRVKLLSSKTDTEELLKRRQLMKKAIAIQRTHVQGMTVEINERRTKASRKEKEAIIAADRKYQPHLKPAEKLNTDEEHEIRKANEDPIVSAMLRELPPQQRNAMLSFVRKLGLNEAKKLWGLSPSPESEPENQTDDEDISNDENEG